MDFVHNLPIVKVTSFQAVLDAAEVSEDFSSEFDGEYPGNFDAADVGLAEVIEEFSRAPDSTPDFRILVTEMVLGDRDQTEIEGSSSQDAQQSAIGYIVGNRVYIETRPPTYV